MSYCVNEKSGGGGGLCIKPKYLPDFVEGRYKYMDSRSDFEPIIMHELHVLLTLNALLLE